MEWYELTQELEPILRKGDLDSCITRAIEVMRKLSASPFHEVVELNFTNSISEVADYLISFLDESKDKIEIKAIYTETNGFDINPDEWYFDLFGYSTYGGHADYDWLSDWQSESKRRLTLTGMESLQRVYESDALNNSEYSVASGIASLIVVLKFQKLINDSVLSIGSIHIPVLATSHDYDFIYECSPSM